LGINWKYRHNLPKFFRHTDAAPLIFKTNGVERVRILPDGNIGIGTQQPQAMLHIEDGEILITKQLSGSPYFSNILGFIIDNFIYSLDFISDSENSGLHLFHATMPFMPPSYSLLFLGNNDFVGIGNKNPKANLDVSGSFKAEIANITDSLSVNKMKVQNANITNLEVVGSLKAQNATITGTLTANELNAQDINTGLLFAHGAEIAGTNFHKYHIPGNATRETDYLYVSHKGTIPEINTDYIEVNGVISINAISDNA